MESGNGEKQKITEMHDAMNGRLSAYLLMFIHIALAHSRRELEQRARHETFSLYIDSSQVKGCPKETITPAIEREEHRTEVAESCIWFPFSG